MSASSFRGVGRSRHYFEQADDEQDEHAAIVSPATSPARANTALIELKPLRELLSSDDDAGAAGGAANDYSDDDSSLTGVLSTVVSPTSFMVGGSIDDHVDSYEYRGGRSRRSMPGEGTSTVLYAVLNFTNSIVGAGIIGLPYAIRQAGFWSGLLLMLAVAGVVDWTVRLLVVSGKLAGRGTYQELVSHCFGRQGLVAVSLFQFLFAFGGMCAYVVIVGDTAPVVLRQLLGVDAVTSSSFAVFLTSRRFVVTLSTLCVCLPLSLYRDISKLAKTSALALFTIIFIVCSVAFEGIVNPPAPLSSPAPLVFIRSSALQAVGVISFAFVCHHNSFLIFGSLRRPTLQRWELVTHLSTGLSALLSLSLGLSGFLIFRDGTRANILNNFSPDDPLINLARGAFAVNMFTTFPLECFVCREVIETFFFPGQSITQRLHVLITVTLTLVALSVALVTCDLGFVLELTGGLSATALAYILPAACYLKLASGATWSWKKAPVVICVMAVR